MFPIFKTNASLGRSILTIEDEDEISVNSPVSIAAITKKYKLDRVFIFDDSFLLFPRIHKNLKDISQVIFGVNYTICRNAEDKTEESLKTESKITIAMKNDAGYEDLLELNNKVCADEKYFYYQPRLDWSILKQMWTKNLKLFIPVYDNFLHNNHLYGYTCVPDFTFTKPVFLYADMGLPFDGLLKNQVTKYCQNNGFLSEECHLVYYYSRADFEAYLNYRCIDNRSNFSKPDLDYMSSDEFCWESFCGKKGVQFEQPAM